MPPRSGNPPRPALALSALALGAASSARAAGVPLGCDKAPWTSYAMCDASLPAVKWAEYAVADPARCRVVAIELVPLRAA